MATLGLANTMAPAPGVAKLTISALALVLIPVASACAIAPAVLKLPLEKVILADIVGFGAGPVSVICTEPPELGLTVSVGVATRNIAES